MTRKTKRILKGAVAGLAGGLAGSLAMNEFQAWLSKTQKPGNPQPSAEPATVKAARTFAKVLHRPLPNDRKNTAGEIVHYVFGALNGAVYGALSEHTPQVRAGAGLLFGAALFLLVDEGVVPLAGWSRAPNRYPLSSHLNALASHLVYGTATNAIRGAVRAAM